MEFRNLLNFIFCLAFIYLSVTWIPLAYTIFIGISGVAAAIRFSEWLMTGTRQYILHKKVNQKNKAILITGCDTGFGHELAKRMYNLGYTVFAACLFPEGDGANTLRNNYSERMKILQLDVTNDLSIEQAKEFVKTNLGKNVLWAVVNNAGILHVGEMDWTPLEDIQKVYNVNTLGMLRVIKAFLPFLKESEGRIVNLNSFGSHHAIPSLGVYCMSKSASLALTTVLRMELAKWGVKAISVEPFLYVTSMSNVENLYATIDNMWKTVPVSVKEEYGENCIKSCKKTFCFYVNNFISSNTHEVIDCLDDAITAQDPLSSYFPCPFLHKVGFRLLFLLPNDLVEFILKSFGEIGRTKPSALLSRKKKE